MSDGGCDMVSCLTWRAAMMIASSRSEKGSVMRLGWCLDFQRWQQLLDEQLLMPISSATNLQLPTPCFCHSTPEWPCA